MRLLASTILGAILSAVYWVVLFQMFYAMSAADYAPGMAQPEGIPGKALAIAIAGFAIYVGAAWLWRAMELRWMASGKPGK